MVGLGMTSSFRLDAGWLALYLGSLAPGLVSRRHMFGWFTPPSRNGVSEEPFDRGRRPARHDPPGLGRSPVRPGKLDMKPAGRLPRAAACRSSAGRPWSPPWRRARFGPWRACLLPLRIRPDGSATGIPRDRLHVRSGMDRLIHSEIRLVQIPPPSSARPAHTPVDRKAGPDPLL